MQLRTWSAALAAMPIGPGTNAATFRPVRTTWVRQLP